MSLMGPPGAIVLLLFTAAVTPGPNNLLMLRIGLESGLHAVLAPATGVGLGGVVVLFILIPYGCLALWAGGGSLAASLVHDTRARVRLERSAGAMLALSGLLLLCRP